MAEFFATTGPIVLGVVLTALLGAVAWLVRTVIGNKGDITKLDRDIRLEMADRYVRRDDYVPQVTQMNVKLDAIGTMVARFDERTATTREGP